MLTGGGDAAGAGAVGLEGAGGAVVTTLGGGAGRGVEDGVSFLDLSL